MQESLHHSAWPRRLNPTLVTSRAIRADLVLRFLGRLSRPLKQEKALGLYIEHALHFFDAVSLVVVQAGNLPLERAG